MSQLAAQVAASCNKLQRVAASASKRPQVAASCSKLQQVAASCSKLLQLKVAASCSKLQHVAALGAGSTVPTEPLRQPVSAARPCRRRPAGVHLRPPAGRHAPGARRLPSCRGHETKPMTFLKRGETVPPVEVPGPGRVALGVQRRPPVRAQ